MSCEKEIYDSSYKEGNSVDKFFNRSTRAPIVDGVINFLKVKNDSLDFIPKFVEKYGMPSWDNSVYLEEDNKYLLVPFKNSSKKEIEGIWTFKIEKNNYIHSFPVIKQKTSERDYWTFDYFTCDVLKKKPKSGLVFDCPKTKGLEISLRCTFGLVEVGEEGEYKRQQVPHCWDEINFLVNDESSRYGGRDSDMGDYMGGEGNYGAGTATMPIDDPKDADKIKDSPIVQKKGKDVMAEVQKSLDKEKGRREAGCYLYYDSKNKTYVCGKIIYGKYVKEGDQTEPGIAPGVSQSEKNGVDKGLTPVGFIHAHTPLTNQPPSWTRPVGPSQADIDWAKAQNIVVIVQDYVGVANPRNPSEMIIKGGHNVNDSTKQYVAKP